MTTICFPLRKPEKINFIINMKTCTKIIIAIILLSFFIAPASYSDGEELKGGTAAGEGKQDPGMRDLLLQLEKQVSDFESLKTDFTQVKDLAVFRNKITIKGRIYLQKPGTVAWHVDEPLKYSVLIKIGRASCRERV